MTELESETKRAAFFEARSKDYQDKYQLKLKQLEEAHALIGRLIHQLSKRWDTAPLTKYMEGLLE